MRRLPSTTEAGAPLPLQVGGDGVTAWRVVVADDEPMARDRIRRLLAEWPAYAIVRECEDGEQAVDAIIAERPDVVLLDVRMPGLDGMDVAAALAVPLGQAAPVVVFVTAFDAYAVKAFEAGALDYLLKPVDRDRLGRALDRVEFRLRAQAAAQTERRAARERDEGTLDPVLDPAVGVFLDTLRRERAYPTRFLVRDAKGMYFIRADDVDWVGAEGNYVGLHAGGRMHLVRDTITAFTARLDPERFVRVHRSAVINIDRLSRLEPHDHGEYVLTMRDGSRLTSSRAYSAQLRALLR